MTRLRYYIVSALFLHLGPPLALWIGGVLNSNAFTIIGVIVMLFLGSANLAWLTWLDERQQRAELCSRLNRCPTCNDDLRATPNQGPECGTKSTPP